jgi:hypothetical protein
VLQDHYPALVLAYLVGLGGWLLAARFLPDVWPRRPSVRFERPWRELGLALLAVVGVLALGQLWVRGVRLPEEGVLAPLTGALNQALIFSPVLLVPVLRKQPRETAWLPRGQIVTRLLVGVALAALAVCAYALLRAGADAPWLVLARIPRYEHLDEAVQVLGEDLAIAILFVRFAAAVGRRQAVVLVAFLFAAGHVPALLSTGASPGDLLPLLRDVGLGLATLLVLMRSRDVLWFWCLHLALDLTQFSRISGVG